MRLINFIKSQKAASLVEYVLALGLLIFVFIIAARNLETAVSTRGSFSMKTGSNVVPCDTGPMANYAGGDGCK